MGKRKLVKSNYCVGSKKYEDRFEDSLDVLVGALAFGSSKVRAKIV